MYIVMLLHPSDISKIEVWVKDQYKLKVNTKKSNKEEMRKSISFVWLLSVRTLFVQGGNKEQEQSIQSSYLNVLSGIMLQMKHSGF